MNTPKKYYFGNYPNSTYYDPSLPIGWNIWDAMDCDIEDTEDEPEVDDEYFDDPEELG